MVENQEQPLQENQLIDVFSPSFSEEPGFHLIDSRQNDQLIDIQIPKNGASNATIKIEKAHYPDEFNCHCFIIFLQLANITLTT